MALTFADTHNIIAFLTKSDASKGFDQIVNFLNAHVIQYALLVNPTIYVSCIKQFWAFVSIKRSNDVMRLQALIDRKKVILTEDMIRQALCLDDVAGVDCLPNEEIFTELARMRYEKPSIKLTFYKAFFLAQWNLVRNMDSLSKFYIYPRFLQLKISAQVGDLSSYTTKYISLALTQKVFANMRRVGKGFSWVDTPLFKGMLVPQQAVDDVADVVVDDVATDVIAEDAVEPTPPSLTPAITPPPQELPSTSQVAPTPPLSPIAQPTSPPQQQPSQPTTISMDLLNTLVLYNYTLPSPWSSSLRHLSSSYSSSSSITSNSVPSTRESKVVKNDNVIALGMFKINPSKTSMVDNVMPNKPVNASVRTKLITNSQPHVIAQENMNSNSNGISFTGVESAAKTRRPWPKSNRKNDRVPSVSKSSCIKNKYVEVKEHHRNLLLPNSKKHMPSECNNVKLAIRNDKSEVVCAMAIAITCYTQNHSIIHCQFKKTPYELINSKKPDISFRYVFGALCYPKNDCEDIGKLGMKGDIGLFIDYSTTSCGYRVYNRRTKKIIETMNVTFDGLDLTYASSTITSQKPTERELDLLFEAMYNDYIGGQLSAAPRTYPAAPTNEVLQTSMASTTTANTAPTPTNSSSQTTDIPNTS
uniref:Integrase, catalytic region, zinc finger, CCHC-type, peptidase aspartic, catalytic n=1 Tax=Tanacetum cinerariifolium TaxID=118510 RepID=A0A6L2KB34_TANCI|nr:integrase, catalytic region, zinc finger, CCHC-type, peptidase aspartic, catalytic [Tanacetum cinerariifolium]